MNPHKNRRSNRAHIVTTALAVVALFLGACQAQSTATQAPSTLTPTSVQFSWFHDVEFAPFYGAEARNYFQDGGLAVQLVGGGFDSQGNYTDPVQRVVEGQADFGIAGADQILRARAQGLPVVAIATIYQRSPIVLISLGAKNITRPQDLVGKRIGVQPATISVGISFEALLLSQGISHADLVERSDINFGSVDYLFDDELDVMQGFITNQAIQAQIRNNGDVNLILMSDYGIDLYTDVLFTTEETIANRPELVQAFLNASCRGAQWAVDNPDATADYFFLSYGKEMDEQTRQVQRQGMLASVPLINPAGSRPCLMTQDAWETAQEILLAQKLLDSPLNLAEVFTLDFLDQFYSGQ